MKNIVSVAESSTMDSKHGSGGFAAAWIVRSSRACCSKRVAMIPRFATPPGPNGEGVGKEQADLEHTPHAFAEHGEVRRLLEIIVTDEKPVEAVRQLDVAESGIDAFPNEVDELPLRSRLDTRRPRRKSAAEGR